MSSAERPTTDAGAVEWLAAKVPDLAPLMDQHITDYDELLPYVLFEGEFLPWFTERVRHGDDEAARAFVRAIEQLMTTDVEPPANDSVWNLSGVCFVEGLRNDQDVVEAARPWMGPNTLKAFSTSL